MSGYDDAEMDRLDDLVDTDPIALRDAAFALLRENRRLRGETGPTGLLGDKGGLAEQAEPDNDEDDR